jgi:hypothetical protein
MDHPLFGTPKVHLTYRQQRLASEAANERLASAAASTREGRSVSRRLVSAAVVVGLTLALGAGAVLASASSATPTHGGAMPAAPKASTAASSNPGYPTTGGGRIVAR